MKYEPWFKEIQTTRMNKNKQTGQVKIYKMLLLLCMLDRGMFDWYKPIYSKEIARNFYRYLTDNELIREITFGDKGREKYIDYFDEKFFIGLIQKNPMYYWGSNKNSHARYNKGLFWIDIDIQPQDYAYVYRMTKELCLTRIEKETGIPFDTRIDLHEEYFYQQKKAEQEHVAETERESLIMTRIGQGKFRNRLFERFNSCIICGIQYERLLIASHIKPWKISNPKEKLDVENGFILCPNHDKLFDKGFITLKNNGEVIISSKIHNDVPKLNLDNEILYPLSNENREYLEWHREKIFDKIIV